MENFTYYTPTQVFFGKGVTDGVGSYINGAGASKVLIIYGGGSVRRSGLLDRLTGQLDKLDIPYTSLGGVEPNPKVDFVRRAAAVCTEEKIDFILAVGGGSVIDTAKCASFSSACGADPWDIITKKVVADRKIPVAVVLTIAGAGSEMSDSEVITNPETMVKQGLSSNLSRPVAAFMDPEITFTVGKYLTGCGAVDTMMHTMERYYTAGDSGTELTDRIAYGLLLSVKEAGTRAINDPCDYDARATLMWASSLSHNGLTGCGKNLTGNIVHKLEHGLSGVFDRVAHGAGLSVLYPAWAQYVYMRNLHRFADMAWNVWGVSRGLSEESAALEGIRAMRDYFASLGMPVTLRELEVYEDSFEKIADVITDRGAKTLPSSFAPLTRDDVMAIFKIAE